MSYLKSKLPELSPSVERERTFSPDLKGLCEWLETQNPATEYPYWNCNGLCLLSRFATACGYPKGNYVPMFGWARVSQFEEIASAEPWTYSAALSRARSALEACARQG